MGLAILILALGTALILARRLTQPLEMFSNATNAIGRGEKNLIDEDSGPDEIRNLAHNFNRMAQQVSELLENRTTLLAGISHDLRTPLTRLRLALEIDGAALDDSVRRQFAQNIEDMEQLLQQSLSLAQGISKQETTARIDLVRFLDVLCAQIEAQNPGRIHFNAAAQIGNHLEFSVAEQALLRILHNLIDNALRYSNDQPVTIRLDLLQARPLISVLDRGPGIPQDQLNQVFRPFYRLEQSRNLKTGGSGLGLAIVKQLADVMGWRISMHPRNGGGNEARLWLR